jgi:hypothetical protein
MNCFIVLNLIKEISEFNEAASDACAAGYPAVSAFRRRKKVEYESGGNCRGDLPGGNYLYHDRKGSSYNGGHSGHGTASCI